MYKTKNHEYKRVCFNSGVIESDSSRNECLKDLKSVIQHHQKVLG